MTAGGGGHGLPCQLTAGSRENIKLTTSVDIAFAEAIYNMRRKLMRIGHG